MNIQRGDKGIGWTDATHNVITGCKQGCPYCYARAMAQRFGRSFDPTFHEDRLDGPGKRRDPLRIFEGSTSDVFGPWVPVDWTERVLDMARAASQHTFQFLTKSPKRLGLFDFPANAWVGTTVTIEGPADLHWHRRIDDLFKVDVPVRFVSFEPLLGDPRGMVLDGLDWVIVGPMTSGGRGYSYAQPEREWVEWIVAEADRVGAAVFMKKALHRYADLWGLPWRREFPNV